uniref:Uncharacterized protein n=1 Tax=Toxoplasma gondii COUG TaxID=1074873 RepID=A0A2G8YB81_TOXGO|nr:hypothetical protein TGCOUG_273705 [Toxoplasma gondii COUG]
MLSSAMKGSLAFVAVASAFALSKPVDALGDIQLAAAIARLFGLGSQPDAVATSNGKGIFGQFLQTEDAVPSNAVPDAAVDNDDDLRAQFEILNTDRYDHLLLTAHKKRKLAEQLRAAADRAQAAVVPSTDHERQRETEESSAEAVFDRTQANIMERQADLLDAEASQVKRLVEAVKVEAERPLEAPTAECDILKIGPVKFVPQSSELLKHSGDETMGRITGTAFTVHYRKTVKGTFFWEGVDLPIGAVADSPNCFSFKYRGNEQVLCASSRLGRDSWIDAMTEAWFCRNMGIKGTLPSIKTAVTEAKKEKIIPPPPPPPTKKPKPARVNVKVSMDKNRVMRVEVNGKEQPVGKHVTTNAAEYVKKAEEGTKSDSVISGLSDAADKLQEKVHSLVSPEAHHKNEESEEKKAVEEETEEEESEVEF